MIYVKIFYIKIQMYEVEDSLNMCVHICTRACILRVGQELILNVKIHIFSESIFKHE